MRGNTGLKKRKLRQRCEYKGKEKNLASFRTVGKGFAMEDVQNLLDQRGIEIQRVGVKEVHLPFLIAKRDGGYQQILGRSPPLLTYRWNKGTHLSRFMEVLVAWGINPSRPGVKADVNGVKNEAQSVSSRSIPDFRYFMPVTALVSGLTSPLDFSCQFWGRLTEAGYDFRLTVHVPVVSVSL